MPLTQLGRVCHDSRTVHLHFGGARATSLCEPVSLTLCYRMRTLVSPIREFRR
jgi:hypothetical protein